MTERVHEAATMSYKRIARAKISRAIDERRTRQKVRLEKKVALQKDRVEMSKKAKELHERARLKRKRA